MRTGEQIAKQALLLLNYVDAYGRADTAEEAGLWRRSMAAVNQIYAELWRQEKGGEPFAPLQSGKEYVQISAYAAYTVMPYGVAMLLAQGEGDGDHQLLYASLYNAKRTAVSREDCRCDVFPRGSDF